MYNKKTTTLCSILLSLTLLLLPHSLYAVPPKEISAEEALLLLLYPTVEKEVLHFYKDYISDGPNVAPYSIEIVDMYREPNENNMYLYTIVVETRPYVGAHVDVGLDRITFSLSVSGIESVTLAHLETTPLPDWLQHHVIKPIPSPKRWQTKKTCPN